MDNLTGTGTTTPAPVGHRRPIRKTVPHYVGQSQGESNTQVLEPDATYNTYHTVSYDIRSYPFYPDIRQPFDPQSSGHQTNGIQPWSIWSEGPQPEAAQHGASLTNTGECEGQRWNQYRIVQSPLARDVNGNSQKPTMRRQREVDSGSEDSSDGEATTHPNKFPVQIEEHTGKHCIYKRQFNKSGEQVKQRVVRSLDPLTLQPRHEVITIRCYEKHMVRICRCGKYLQMDGALQQGRNNDCDGYEIHYSQKCRWKAYDDFKTGKRVLIRLCKCYKP